jgi:hypothetical protein
MTQDRTKLKTWGRWVGTFIGFPLAGVAARIAAGNIDSAGAAVVGGLAGGAVLGALQAVIGGIDPVRRARWVGATAAGLAVGLTAGANAVDYRTDTASLVAMGAISGSAVGLAQMLSVPMRAVDRVLWALATPALWAGGWFVTSQVIVDADRQHAMFGGPGSAVVAALAGLLVVRRDRPAHASTVPAALVSSSSDRQAA